MRGCEIDKLQELAREMQQIIKEPEPIEEAIYSLEPDYKLGYAVDLKPVIAGGRTQTSSGHPSPSASATRTVASQPTWRLPDCGPSTKAIGHRTA